MSDGYVYDFSASTGVLSRAKPLAGQPVQADGDPRVFEYAYTPACGDNGPPDEEGVFAEDPSCIRAQDDLSCPPAEFAMWAYRRQVAPNPEPTPWERMPGVTCIGAEETWTVAELTAGATGSLREYLEENAETPRATAQPEGGSLVNLPVVVHTPRAADVELEVTVPLPGLLRAEPSYAWDFGEPPLPGEQVEGPGRPFEAAVLPSEAPGYYVAHAYGTPGSKTITVTNTWTATFSVAGIDIPLDAIVFTDDVAVPVTTARSELVASS